MNQLLQIFKETIKEENLFSQTDRLLIACSGGMDSVVLCALCFQSGFDFQIAHANFQLRDKESARDEAFVLALGKKYGKDVLVKRFSTEEFALERKLSIQAAARELRYAWFQVLAADQKAWIMTAHHLDDNIETVIMNFFKGTGIAGLRGILFKQGRILRPLIFADKEELRRYAMELQLEWVEDSSNESIKYTRNYFRHQVIPLVLKIYPGAIGNLARNIERFRDIETLYRRAVDQQMKMLIQTRGNEIHIPVLKLKKAPAPTTILYEIMKGFGFSSPQAREAMNLFQSESGKFIDSATHRIIKNRDWLIIASIDASKAETILIDEHTSVGIYPEGQLEFSRFISQESLDITRQGNHEVAMLDARRIKYPLLLRKWTKGDYFYPLGMRKKKKIARFLIDNKLSQFEKQRVWVLETDKKIIWLVGLRIDDRFKIESSTTRVLKIEMRVT
jgi:tRNA(Ile)-lysidine synthase